MQGLEIFSKRIILFGHLAVPIGVNKVVKLGKIVMARHSTSTGNLNLLPRGRSVNTGCVHVK